MKLNFSFDVINWYQDLTLSESVPLAKLLMYMRVTLRPCTRPPGCTLDITQKTELAFRCLLKDSREGSGLSAIESSQGSHPFYSLFIKALLFQLSYDTVPWYRTVSYTHLRAHETG